MHILCSLTGYKPRYLKASLGDVHIYEQHLEAVKEQITREPLKLPTVLLPEITCLEDLDKLTAKDFGLFNYKPHEAIKAPLSVG